MMAGHRCTKETISQGKYKKISLGKRIVGNTYRRGVLSPGKKWFQKEHGRVVDAQLYFSSVAGRVTSVLTIYKQGDIA